MAINTPKLDAFRAAQEESEKKLKAEGRSALAEALGGFLLAYPVVTGVRWNQYTPHFNDGDACVFRLGEVRVTVEGGSKDAGDYNDGWLGSYECRDATFSESSVPVPPGFGADLDALDETMRAVKPVCLASFGDGYEITATRDGTDVKFQVEDYDHD